MVGHHLGFGEGGAGEVADHQRFVGREGRHRRLVGPELALGADFVRIPAAAVHAREAAQHVAVHLPDVAVVGGEDGAKALRHLPGEVLQGPGLIQAIAELHELPERRVAAAQAGEQLGVAQCVRDRASGLPEEPADVVEVPRVRVEQVDEPDHLIVADQWDGGGAVEVPLEVVVALVFGDPLVVERADDEDLPLLQRLFGGRVVVEVQDVAADALVDAAVVDAREAAEVPLLEPPDVAVHAAGRLPQARRGALRHVPRVAGDGELRAQVHELLAQARDFARLSQERRAVEHAGDELADAREELHLVGPVALGVVVQVDEPDQFAPGDQRHRQRAGEAPLPVHLRLRGAQARIAQVRDHQRRVVEQRVLQRGVVRGVQHLVAQVRVGAVFCVADDAADHAAGGAPDVDALHVRRREQPLREAPHETLEVVALRHFAREVDQLADAPVAVFQLFERALDGDGLRADAGEAVDGVRVPGEVPLAGVAQLDRAGELPVQHDRRPGE